MDARPERLLLRGPPRHDEPAREVRRRAALRDAEPVPGAARDRRILPCAEPRSGRALLLAGRREGGPVLHADVVRCVGDSLVLDGRRLRASVRRPPRLPRRRRRHQRGRFRALLAPSAGTGTYDVSFGPANPPPLLAFGLASISFTPPRLVGERPYYWSVVAHAACDPSQRPRPPSARSGSPGRVYPARDVLPRLPRDGATAVLPMSRSRGRASAGSTGYDLYLGPASSPPLYLSGVTSTSLAVRGLAAGATYRWKVVASTSCAPGAVSQTPVRSFTVRGTCTAPGPASFTFLPPGSVGTGQTYVVAWKVAVDLNAGGAYVVERSTSASFTTVLDAVTTTALFASFVAPSPGSLHHRVRAVPSCDPSRAGPWSATAPSRSFRRSRTSSSAAPPRPSSPPSGSDSRTGSRPSPSRTSPPRRSRSSSRGRSSRASPSSRSPTRPGATPPSSRSSRASRSSSRSATPVPPTTSPAPTRASSSSPRPAPASPSPPTPSSA